MLVSLPTRHVWLLMIPILLLASLLGARHLRTDAFATDEVASMLVARGPFYEYFTPVEVWNRVANRSPDQAIGLALILSNWGAVFGWSEVSTRTLAFFAGVVALALVYRLGRDLFSPLSGLAAALILSTSVFFITYMQIVRVFTLVALVAALTVWCYWRIVLHSKPPSRAAYLGLFLGSVGLFYTHYFATLLLPVIGLYHVLFAPRNRRWWWVVVTVALAGLLFLPELWVFVRGVQRNLGNTRLHDNAMTIPEAISRLVYFLSNGVLQLDSGALLAVAAVGVVSVFVYRAQVQRLPLRLNRNLVFLIFLAAGLLLLILGANVWLRAMSPQRLRYTMALWPLLALIAGYGLWCLKRGRVAALILTGWVLVGLWTQLATDFRYEIDSFAPNPLHHIHDVFLQDGSTRDLIVINGFWAGNGRPRDFYTSYDIVIPRRIVYHDNPALLDELDQAIDNSLRVWLLAEGRDSEKYDTLEASLREDFIYCQTIADEVDLVLSLYARAEIFCQAGDPLLEFGDSITLTNLAPLNIENDALRVDMVWQVGPNVPRNVYSVGLYLMDADSREVVTQMDYGLLGTAFGPARSVFDVRDLPAGVYELYTSVYTWATVIPLPGVDLRSGEQGNVLLLDRFVVE